MFVLAVNGAYETYHPRFDSPVSKVGAGRRSEQSAGAGGETPAAVEPALLAAHQAYARTQGDPLARKPALRAQDIMSTPVTAIRPEASLADAWALMKARGFRHIPVVSAANLLAGILSDRDLLRFANVLERGEPASLPGTVRDIMTPKVLTATATTEIREIARVMAQEKIGAMPILDETNRPIGMLTVTDILRAVVNRAPLELWS